MSGAIAAKMPPPTPSANSLPIEPSLELTLATMLPAPFSMPRKLSLAAFLARAMPRSSLSMRAITSTTSARLSLLAMRPPLCLK
ncbi:hypothetical protein [Mesorhizobium sp. SP-1A]|uniref:hypothetical protein n=1 Tax=Mesorhizobium sp. SP-1A TaxID=3077840 RepID=UPI0028F6ECDA|nr:hypothetical protein [Mesorhizobium sp. SP-1A]